MKYLIPILILLANGSFGKDSTLYVAPDADLFDLIRGIPPKDGVLKLSKAEATDNGKLPDGLYYIPEDDGLTSEDASILHVQRKTEKPKNVVHKPVSEADEKDNQ